MNPFRIASPPPAPPPDTSADYAERLRDKWQRSQRRRAAVKHALRVVGLTALALLCVAGTIGFLMCAYDIEQKRERYEASGGILVQGRCLDVKAISTPR